MLETGKMEDGALAPGLRRIRRRRWYLWGLIIAYLPLMVIAIGSAPDLSAAAAAFAGWFILLSAATMAAALARCPRCGNRFHLQAMTLLPSRRCLHCALPLNADKHR